MFPRFNGSVCRVTLQSVPIELLSVCKVSARNPLLSNIPTPLFNYASLLTAAGKIYIFYFLQCSSCRRQILQTDEAVSDSH
jgi:hypothetical protein